MGKSINQFPEQAASSIFNGELNGYIENVRRVHEQIIDILNIDNVTMQLEEVNGKSPKSGQEFPEMRPKIEQKKSSDLDILVEFQQTVGLFEFMELEEFLETKMGVKIDLVSKKALKPRIGKHILEEVINV